MDSMRNFRDFLTIYNQISESCFTRCVNTFQTRDLTDIENQCVEQCTNKNVRVNHKVMAIYMEVQPLIVQKRIEEMDRLNASALQAQTETVNDLDSSSPPADVSSSVEPKAAVSIDISSANTDPVTTKE